MKCNNPQNIRPMKNLLSILLLVLTISVSAQPQNNICDTTCQLTGVPLGYSFQGKTLTVTGSFCAMEVKRFYAWENPNGGFFEFNYWGGRICSNTFYDYYLNTGKTFQDEVEYLMAIYQPFAVLRGANRARVRYEITANGVTISTTYIKP